MQTYILFLRAINVGGKNKVVMADLKMSLSQAPMAFDQVTTYINSGNVLFQTDLPYSLVCQLLSDYFANQYDFDLPFALMTKAAYLDQWDQAPDWWFDKDLYRRNALFFTHDQDLENLAATFQAITPGPNELIYLGPLGIFWAVTDPAGYNQSAYHKQLIKSPIYPKVTIRNFQTSQKMATLVQNLPDA